MATLLSFLYLRLSTGVEAAACAQPLECHGSRRHTPVGMAQIGGADVLTACDAGPSRVGDGGRRIVRYDGGVLRAGEAELKTLDRRAS